jgi:hypothetical protein
MRAVATTTPAIRLQINVAIVVALEIPALNPFCPELLGATDASQTRQNQDNDRQK